MKKIGFSLILVALTLGTFAKSNNNKNEAKKTVETTSIIEISGIVTDKLSNEALVGVEVKIEGTNQKVYTDFDGRFTFNNLNLGEYNLVASYISYKKNVIKHVNVEKTDQVTICLESSN